MTDPQPPAEPAAELDPSPSTGPEAEPSRGSGSALGAGSALEPGLAPSPADLRRSRRPASVHLALVVVAVLAGGALFVSGFALGALRATTPGTPVDEAAAFQPFWDAYRSITQDYAGGPVERKQLIDGAIRGMIGALDDPFSAYLSPEEYRQSLQGLSGQFEGIGAQVETRRVSGDGACAAIGEGCVFIVVEPTPDAPAAQAGLLAEDRIVAIDGATVDGLTSDQALAKVRGPKGTTVTLSIVRAGGAPFDLPIVRAVIIQSEVTARTLADGGVGYIRLRGFSDRAATQFSQAVAADVAAGRQKLIVDLRGNPGGYVLDAQQVVSQFVPAGTTIFSQEDAAGARVPTTAVAGGSATDPAIQVVVLIDGGSASASEIVAGALQDLGRAKLVGTKSYGKGTVQVWQQLADDNGGFRLTVAKWLTPNGRWIHKVGLTPDVAVDPAGAAAGSDPTLDRALEVLAAATTGSRRLARAA